QIGLWPGRDEVGARIETRFHRMIDAGFVDEVRGLGSMSRTARQALGYRQMLEHIEHGTPLDDCIEAAISASKRFARRQRVWFRRDPRIAWVPSGIAAEAFASL